MPTPTAYTSPALISPPNVNPGMSPTRARVAPVTPPTVLPFDDIHARYKLEAEQAVRSATEQMTSYNAMMENTNREMSAGSALAHMQVQCDAKLSSLQLQQTAEIDRLRRIQEDAAREHELTVRHLQQQHESNMHLLETKHKQEMTTQAARFEEYLQANLAKQHEEYSEAVNKMAAKHRETLQELEQRWAAKEASNEAGHEQQLARLRRDAEAQLRQIEGSFTLEQQQHREKDMKERAEQNRMISEKMHMVETKSLELQMQVVDLTSKLDTAAAQLRATEAQHARVKERMEHNLKDLMNSVEEERKERKDVEVTMRNNVQEANHKLQAAVQKHNNEMHEQASAYQQQIARLQAELHKVVDNEREREAEVQRKSRQMERDMAQFQEKLHLRLQEQLHALNLKHTTEMQNMQMQMQMDAKAQNTDNVRAIDKAYTEKIKCLELDSQQQLKEAMFEVQRLTQDLASQKELSALEEQTQKQMYSEKMMHMKEEYERELENKVQDLKSEYDMSLKKQDREFSLRLEQEKLAFAQQCREITADVQERDRELVLRLEEEIRKLTFQKAELEDRRVQEAQAAELTQEQIRADAHEAVMEISQSHIAQLKAAEGENAKLREEVELRLAAAAERYNEQLSGLDHEKRSIHDVVQGRIDEMHHRHREEMERLTQSTNAQLSQASNEVQRLKEHADQLAMQITAYESEILHLKMQLETKHLEACRLADERDSVIKDRETAFSTLSDKMQQQLAAAENERVLALQRIEEEKHSDNKRVLQEKLQLAGAHEKYMEAQREIARLQAVVDSQTRHIATMQSISSTRPSEDMSAVQEKFAIIEEANSRLRKQLEDAHVQMAQVRAGAAGQASAARDFSEDMHTRDRDLMAVTMEMADTQAVQRIYEAEQKHIREKNEMYESFQQQLQEAERVAQHQLSKVGEKFTQQMKQLQDLVTSLQQKLMTKDSQTRYIDQELKRAQKAIGEITAIHHAREQQWMAELQMSRGYKQQNMDLQAQHIQDNQKLIALQAQVQEAMASMYTAVHEGSPKEEIFLSPKSQMQLVPSVQPQVQAFLPQFPLLHSSQGLPQLPVHTSTPQKSKELQLFESTPTKPFHAPALPSVSGHEKLSKAQIQAQHEFSQQLANQQAAILKNQQQQTLSFLRSPQQAGLVPQTLSNSQVAAL
eukprot:TRINITY_DN6700_c0_g1_i1.p1 TRINITY_DN6700_c0_g1~~TRINITY_DN6700_c0_g1_i1.p1  ORF type:complete len:1165 (+),score=430.48 TRINITY_DN6700_c0_g1_i1:34-3528(+)